MSLIVVSHWLMRKNLSTRKMRDSGLRFPFGVKACAVIKRFLSSDTGCGQGCVEIGAANRFLFGHSLGKKYGKASDKSIARTAAVDAVDGERKHVCAIVAAGEKRSIRSQRDNHAPNAAGY
jgi:hypothetical protein